MKQFLFCVASFLLFLEATAQTSDMIEASVQIEIAPAQCELTVNHQLYFGELTRPPVGSATATLDPTAVTSEADPFDDLSYTLDADNSDLVYDGQPILGRFNVQPLNATTLTVELVSTPPSLDWVDPTGVTHGIPYSPQWAFGEQFYGAFELLNTSGTRELDVTDIDQEGEAVYFRVGGSLSQITADLEPELYEG